MCGVNEMFSDNQDVYESDENMNVASFYFTESIANIISNWQFQEMILKAVNAELKLLNDMTRFHRAAGICICRKVVSFELPLLKATRKQKKRAIMSELHTREFVHIQIIDLHLKVIQASKVNLCREYTPIIGHSFFQCCL